MHPHTLHLLAQRRVLQTMLAETPDIEAVTRECFQRRHDQVERELARSRCDAPPSPSVNLTPTDHDLRHEEQTLTGEFGGVLPTGREFEFQLHNGTEVIHGYLSHSITNPDTLNDHLHQPTRIQVVATNVGHGPPCYRLMVVSQWQDDAADVVAQALPPSDS